jgi:hypothetical protein
VAVGPTTTDAVHDVAVTADDPGPKGASLHDVTMHLDWGQPSFGALLHLVLPHGALNTVNNATTCPQKPKSQGVPWYQKYGPRGYPGRELDFQVFFFLVGTVAAES